MIEVIIKSNDGEDKGTAAYALQDYFKSKGKRVQMVDNFIPSKPFETDLKNADVVIKIIQ